VDNLAKAERNDALLSRLERLDEECKRLTRRAKALERQRTSVEVEMIAITHQLDLGRAEGAGHDAGIGDHRFAPADYASEEIAASTVAEASDHILRRAGRPLTIHQLLEVFEASGRNVGGVNAHRVVYAALRRNAGRFTRLGPRLFDIKPR